MADVPTTHSGAHPVAPCTDGLIHSILRSAPINITMKASPSPNPATVRSSGERTSPSHLPSALEIMRGR